MTVYELKCWLEEFPDEDTRIVFKPENSDYVDDIKDVKKKIITSMWSDDYEAYVIGSAGKVGSV